MKIKIRLGDADADRTLLLSRFQVAGCKAPLELYTHQIKSTTSAFNFRRVLDNRLANNHIHTLRCPGSNLGFFIDTNPTKS